MRLDHRLYMMRWTAVVSVVGLGTVLLLNVYPRFEGLHLSRGSPPYDKLPPNECVHALVGGTVLGWPRTYAWTYQISGKRYWIWDLPQLWENSLFGLALLTIAVIAIQPLVIIRYKHYRQKALSERRCPGCAYDVRVQLSAGIGSCPECGEELTGRATGIA